VRSVGDKRQLSRGVHSMSMELTRGAHGSGPESSLARGDDMLSGDEESMPDARRHNLRQMHTHVWSNHNDYSELDVRENLHAPGREERATASDSTPALVSPAFSTTSRHQQSVAHKKSQQLPHRETRERDARDLHDSIPSEPQSMRREAANNYLAEQGRETRVHQSPVHISNDHVIQHDRDTRFGQSSADVSGPAMNSTVTSSRHTTARYHAETVKSPDNYAKMHGAMLDDATRHISPSQAQPGRQYMSDSAVGRYEAGEYMLYDDISLAQRLFSKSQGAGASMSQGAGASMSNARSRGDMLPEDHAWEVHGGGRVFEDHVQRHYLQPQYRVVEHGEHDNKDMAGSNGISLVVPNQKIDVRDEVDADYEKESHHRPFAKGDHGIYGREHHHQVALGEINHVVRGEISSAKKGNASREAALRDDLSLSLSNSPRSVRDAAVVRHEVRKVVRGELDVLLRGALGDVVRACEEQRDAAQRSAFIVEDAMRMVTDAVEQTKKHVQVMCVFCVYLFD
jgi:hypothetical protein